MSDDVVSVKLDASEVIIDFQSKGLREGSNVDGSRPSSAEYVAAGTLEIRLGSVELFATQVDERCGATAEAVAYDILGHQDASPRDNLELLTAAHAARHHWKSAGRVFEVAKTDWILARAYLRVGAHALALQHAELCNAAMHDIDTGAYERASALEVLARCLAASRSNDEALRYLRSARDTAATITSADQLALFEEDLNSGDWYGLR